MLKRINKFILATSTIVFSLNLMAAEADKLTIMTEVYHPFNFQKENGEATGIGADLITEMLKRVNSKLTRSDINIMPWDKAYKTALEKPNHILFSTTRSEARENMFKWVGPIALSSTSLIAKKSNNIVINSFEDMNKVRIGAVSEDFGEQLMVNNGLQLNQFTRVSGTDALNQAIELLDSGKIDVFNNSIIAFKWAAKDAGYNPSDYEEVFMMDNSELFFAMNIQTSDAIVTELQNALDSIVADGTYQAIVNKYLR